jgi:MYXO-CTERM domain-containing protein
MKGTRARFDGSILLAALVVAVGCSGDGCGGCAGMEPIPGGFPADKRNQHAAQVRVSSGAIAKIEANPAGFLGPLVGGATNGVIEFNIPASCGGNVEICCVGGQPQATCGPLLIDLVTKSPAGQPGDGQRLELNPAQGASRLDVIVRSRVRTKNPIRIGAFGANCNDATIDTRRGTNPDLNLDLDVNFPQHDATAQTTRIQAANTAVNLEGDDFDVCGVPSFIKDAAEGFIEGQIEGQIEDAINGATCKACASGQVSECASPFATACTDQVCMAGNRCLQEVGLTGRMRAGNVLASFSPGTLGAIDLYEILGGAGRSDNAGLGFSMLGGMEPGGAPRDRCGPPATPPAKPAITVSPFFTGNTRPDTGAPFDVAIGLHKWQLDQFAYAAYDGGFLCLTISGNTISQLTTDTLSLISRSLGDLNEGNSPMAVGLRPQSPPVITLGKNTFTDDGMGNVTLTEPLLDLQFTAMEIDFFAAVNDQFVRVFTVVSDVRLPIGLQVTGMGELQPVIGEVENAFTNISVKNSEAVTESPAQLAMLFPNVLNLVLPQLSGGLSPIALPELGGLQLSVTGITATPQNVGGTDNTYLAIFANLAVAPFTQMKPVETQVALGDVFRPDAVTMKNPALWHRGQGPTVQLSYGDRDGLEYSYRIDSGTWSPWSTNKRPTLRSGVFWLPATHTIEVRAREIGNPATMDLTPVRLDIDFRAATATKTPRVAPFHGQPGEAGCNCQTTSAAGASPLLLVFALIVLPLRRLRRRIKRLGLAAWLTAIAMLPGCSCGSSNKCGDASCMEGEVPRGSLGHWTSIAGDNERVMVATYDQGLGDLVTIDVTNPDEQKFVAVDGVPDVPAVYEGDYRGGIEEAGENVGAFTSIGFSNGHAMVAYQDRDNHALKFAFEKKAGSWTAMTIDGASAGTYASLAVDRQGIPAIAYVATGIDNGMNQRLAELRVVRASVTDPQSAERWGTPAVVASAPASCGGLCGSDVCIAGMMGEQCAPIDSTCTSACATGEACVAGACTEVIAEPMVSSIGSGTGLFAQLLVLPDDRLAVVYYNYFARALEIAVESGPGTGTYDVTRLDGGDNGDRGMWARAAVDGAGTVHVAYQDALGDQLMYTTWSGGTAGTPEVVDDGTRPNDRPHPVGAGATLFLANGGPSIAYQDGLASDVYLATKGAGGWTKTALAQGPLLDGFWVSGTAAHQGTTYVAWGSLDPNAIPLGTIVVQRP